MSTASPAKTPNPLLEIVLTIVLPSIVLDQLSKPTSLGPFWALIVSLIFPLGFGLWCWVTKMGWNLFSILGLTTILLSGGLGLFKLDAFWFAIKESVIPILLGLGFPLSHRWSKPLINHLVLQPQVVNLKALNEALAAPEKKQAFEATLYRASWGLAGGMFFSSVANFFLALWLLGGKEPGSETFVKGIGTLNWAGALVIGIPLLGIMAALFMWLLGRVQRITGLDKDDLLNPGRTVRRTVG